MKRLCLWLVFFVVVGVQSVLAQSYTVKGKVVSKTSDEPLIGVSILQKGTTNGVVTDIDGNYVLQIQGGEATLVFSYIVNPEKPDVPINKNDAFQKVQKRRVQEKR